MIVHYETIPGQPLTKEQIKEIRDAEKMTPVYDEDCPELSLAMMKSLKAAVRNRNRIKNQKMA